MLRLTLALGACIFVMWGCGSNRAAVSANGESDPAVSADVQPDNRRADRSNGFRVARLFGDHMVMQREAQVPVWGWAAPGTNVEVRLGDVELSATAAEDSLWLVTLPEMPAGGPHVLTVRAGNQEHRFENILFGDVWVASGQSNMEWEVASSMNAEQEIASGTDPTIRHFEVPHSWSAQPENELAGGEWQRALPEHIGSFSAVGFFFARELRKHIDVPIGIIQSAWGGSRIEPWMSAEALGLDENAYREIMERERHREQQLRAALRERIGGELPTADAGMQGGRAVWADPELDDSGWGTIAVPRRWEEVGYEGLDGVAWYRTSFELSEAEASRPITLGLGMIDDADVSFVNGHRVGGMEQAWNRARVYEVPAEALRAGTNVVAVRVEDTAGGGGITGASDLLYIEVGGRRRPLAGDWKFRVGIARVNLEAEKNQIPTLLYNKMIHPMLSFPIKGVIWYQGESNAYPDQAVEYRNLFRGMITDWRERWNPESGENFPFLWVSLANYMDPTDDPGASSGWALLRESQSAALTLPNTAEAVAIDIGEADDIHPRNKQEVGRRLALAARAVTYGQKVVHSGPRYVGHVMRDGRMVLAFSHVGRGLRARGGPLRGFAIAGRDGQFVWANAEIQGETVVVWSDQVREPVAVRYAWADNPEGANLYNGDGLPAAPFRTDEW